MGRPGETGIEQIWIDIKGHHAIGKAERIETAIELGESAKDGFRFRNDLGEFRNGRAVNLLDSGVGRIWIDWRQDGISSDPIEISPQSRSPSPARHAPGALWTGIGRVLHASGHVGGVVKLKGTADNLRTDVGFGGSGPGKAPFIVVIDL